MRITPILCLSLSFLTSCTFRSTKPETIESFAEDEEKEDSKNIYVIDESKVQPGRYVSVKNIKEHSIVFNGDFSSPFVLAIENNQNIKSIHIPSTLKVKNISIQGNISLNRVILKDNPYVQSLLLYDNANLQLLEMANLPQLGVVNIGKNKLAELDFTTCSQIDGVILGIDSLKFKETHRRLHLDSERVSIETCCNGTRLALANTVKYLTIRNLSDDTSFYLEKDNELNLIELHLPDALVDRSHQLAHWIPRTPQNLARIVNSLLNHGGRVEFERESVLATAGGAAGGAREVVGQEALTAERKLIVEGWHAFSVKERELITSLMPENFVKAKEDFMPLYKEVRADLETLIKNASEPDKFRYEMAKLTLDGFALKPNIPSYTGYWGTRTHWSEYREADIEGTPKSLQLLVFLMRLTKRSLIPSFREYVAAKIVESRPQGTEFVTIKKSQLAEIFPDAERYSSVAEYLRSSDGITDLDRFARSEEGLKTASQKKFRQSLRREYIKIQDKDRFAALVEALFMTMRGHNRSLHERTEAHRPACPYGSYLNILKAFADPTLGLEANALSGLSGVIIEKCD